MWKFRLWCAGFVAAMVLVTADGAWAAKGGPHAYLMRGIFNVSVGLDELAGKLGHIGIASTVYGPTDESEVVAEVSRDYRAGRVRSVILIGHSLGAGAVMQVARELNDAGIPVALLISLDPVSSNTVAANVRQAINYYVTGTGQPVGRDAGFRGDLKNIDVGDEPGMGHMAVQSAESMHKRMIANVRAALGGTTAGKSKTPAAEKHARVNAIP